MFKKASQQHINKAMWLKSLKVILGITSIASIYLLAEYIKFTFNQADLDKKFGRYGKLKDTAIQMSNCAFESMTIFSIFFLFLVIFCFFFVRKW